MKYITFYVISILVLSKLNKDNIIKLYNKRKMRKEIKQFFISNKKELHKLK